MTINEMKEKKKEKGYTYAQMSVLSGVPLGTIQKIFSGETESPRYDTLQALEQLSLRNLLYAKRLPIRLTGMAAILLTTIMHCRMNNV